MRNLYIFPLLLAFSLGGSTFVSAQDASEEVAEISTVEALLALEIFYFCSNP